jgi:hypothetical protein
MYRPTGLFKRTAYGFRSDFNVVAMGAITLSFLTIDYII